MSNYVIKRSDPANGSFIVQSDQIDGTTRPWNAALYTNPVSALTALSSNSSLVIAGRGITDYGELVQNNLQYLMENFAYKTRPLTPSQGQIWYKNADFTDPSFPSDPTTAGLFVWNGTAWSPILAANIIGNVELGGARITGLGDAINPQDALNRQSGDARYLQLAGGTTTGAVTFSAGAVTVSGGSFAITGATTGSISATPTIGAHITNKTYVDGQITIVTGLVSTETANRTSADAVLQGEIDVINTSLSGFIQDTGDTMTGTLSFDPNASIFAVGGGTGTFSFGLKKLQQVGDPTTNQDATTKFYVDSAITTAIASLPPSATSDGVVYDGNLNGVTGVLTLNRTLGLPDVTITGNFAPFSHVHAASQVLYDLSTPYGQSVIAGEFSGSPGYPQVPLNNAVRVLDQQVSGLLRPIKRKLFVGDGTTATFTLSSLMEYSVEDNKMSIFMDGVKQYANERGNSTIVFTDTPIGLDTSTGITGTFTFDITVDGGAPTTISITAVNPYSYLDLFNDLDAALATALVPVQINLDQYFDKIAIMFWSNTTGAGSAVTVSYSVGELFPTITTSATPINTSVASDLAYFEVGNAGDPSTSFTFNTAPPLGAVLEVLLAP